MLTEATVQEPGMLESSLHLQRLSRDVARTYTVQIKSNEVKTYLYGKKKVSVSDGKGKISEVDVIDVESLPQSNLAGIRYNNITEFPQNDIQVGYSEGNEYGNMVRGKNAMDSKYNMSLRLKGRDISACGCRDYAGIGQFSGNQLYFKFYDNITYDGISSEDGVSLT